MLLELLVIDSASTDYLADEIIPYCAGIKAMGE